MTCALINVLSFFRSTTKPEPGSGIPFIVTIKSKLWPCQFSFAQGPNTSTFCSLDHVGLYNLCAALKCSLRETYSIMTKVTTSVQYKESIKLIFRYSRLVFPPLRLYISWNSEKIFPAIEAFRRRIHKRYLAVRFRRIFNVIT